MKFNGNKIFSFMLAAAFALTLAGCGGGGGTTDTTDPTTPTPMPDPPLVAAQNAAATAASNANQSYMDAMAAVDAVEDDMDLDMASYDAAMAAAGEAKTASESAASLSRMAAGTDSVADAEKYAAQAQLRETDAADALADAQKYAGMVTAAKTAADATATRLAANAVVKTKEDAIAAEVAQTTDGGLGGSTFNAAGDVTGAVDTYSIAISRDDMGTKVEITDTDMEEEDDPKFEIQDMNLGEGRTMHVRKNGMGVEEVVIVSTDIEAPKAVAFTEFKVATENAEGKVTGTTMPQELDVSTDDEATDFEALGIVGGETGNLGMVKADSFKAPAGTVGTVNLPFQYAVEDDASTPEEDESKAAAEIMGTFNGAMGMFKCNAESSNCSVTVDTKGVVSGVSNDNDWIFIPADGATSDQSEYDYLHYGFWLKRTTKDGAVTSYSEVETFADSSVAASGSVDAVVGSAMYEGGAVGVYVKNVYNSDRTLDTASSGHFTADVNLMAYFGGPDVAENKQDTIEGTIDKFMLSGGEENSWSVTLKSTTSNTGTHSGTAMGGMGDGSFSATFHGNVAAVDGVSPQPGSVVGEFNAGFSDGAVAGAFGARKVME